MTDNNNDTKKVRYKNISSECGGPILTTELDISGKTLLINKTRATLEVTSN